MPTRAVITFPSRSSSQIVFTMVSFLCNRMFRPCQECPNENMDATGLTRHRVELFHDPENAAVNIGSQQMGGPAGINIMLDATLAARCNRSVLKHDELAL